MQASSNPVCGTFFSRVLKLFPLLILTFYWFRFQPYRCKRQPLSVCPVSNIVRLFKSWLSGYQSFCRVRLWKPLETNEFSSTRPWKSLKFSFIHFGPWKFLNFNWGTFSNLQKTLVNTSFEATRIKSELRKPIIYYGNIFIVYSERVLQVIKLSPLKSKNAVLESSWIVLKFYVGRSVRTLFPWSQWSEAISSLWLGRCCELHYGIVLGTLLQSCLRNGSKWVHQNSPTVPTRSKVGGVFWFIWWNFSNRFVAIWATNFKIISLGFRKGLLAHFQIAL